MTEVINLTAVRSSGSYAQNFIHYEMAPETTKDLTYYRTHIVKMTAAKINGFASFGGWGWGGGANYKFWGTAVPSPHFRAFMLAMVITALFHMQR